MSRHPIECKMNFMHLDILIYWISVLKTLLLLLSNNIQPPIYICFIANSYLHPYLSTQSYEDDKTKDWKKIGINNTNSKHKTLRRQQNRSNDLIRNLTQEFYLHTRHKYSPTPQQECSMLGRWKQKRTPYPRVLLVQIAYSNLSMPMPTCMQYFPYLKEFKHNTSDVKEIRLHRRWSPNDLSAFRTAESRSAWFNSHTDRANFSVEPVPAGWSHRTHACIRMTHTAMRCVAEASTRFASRIRFRKGWKERTRKTWCSSGSSTESHHHKTMSRRLSDAFVWRVVTLVRTVRGSSQERIWHTAHFLWAASQETFTLKGNTCRVDSQAKDSFPTKLSNKTAKSLHTYGTHCLRWQRSRSKWSRTGFPVRFSGTNSIHRRGKERKINRLTSCVAHANCTMSGSASGTPGWLNFITSNLFHSLT